MKWRSYSLSFDFNATSGYKEFIEELLLSVTGAFGGGFLGHAKSIVKAGGKSCFASTTAIPPVVEWKPPAFESGEISGSAEAVWIFIAWDGHIPSITEVRRLYIACAEKHGVVVHEKQLSTTQN